MDISASPIIIIGPAENLYDLVYNEMEFPAGSSQIQLDNVILGISTDPNGQIYYEVFNWGNGIIDFNTNISAYPEADNQAILMSDLWNFPGTGVLIDADNAASQPPPGTYNYLVIVSPFKAGADTIDVDSILIFP